MKNDIMLSVIIISYNQEKYIRDAIESVINQKTKYKYEILLADDCSPDNTKKILEEYKKKYPDLITIVSRPKNLGATANSFDACCHSCGKYICILEGDDYWCDKNKIDIQVDFLEKNPKYIGISHLQKGIDEQNEFTGLFPSWVKKDCDVTLKNFLKEKLFSETSTIFKNIYLEEKKRKNIQDFASFSREVGDYQKCIFLLVQGSVRIICKPMMVYRCLHNSENYNSRYKLDEVCLEHLKITRKLDDYYKNKYNFSLKYSRFLFIGITYGLIHHRLNLISKMYNTIPKSKKISSLICCPYVVANIIACKIREKIVRKKDFK